MARLRVSLKKHGTARLFAQGLLASIQRIEKFVAARNPHFHSFFVKHPLDASAIETAHVTPVTSTPGSTFQYTHEELNKIKSLHTADTNIFQYGGR